MTTPVLCLGFRDWHLAHLDRGLETLSASGWPIILVDFGSHPTVAAIVRRLAMRHPTVTLLPQAAREWSRGQALNCAAHAAPPTDTLVFTDADMLFPPDWFAVATAMLDTPGGREQVWLTDSRDLPRLSGQEPPAWWHSPAWLQAASTPHDRIGQGAAMLVPRAWFDRVGGFDEYYHIWGCEDNDLVLRATWDGVPHDWLPGAWVAHQWHPRDWPTPEQYQQVQRNRDYLAHRIAERGPVMRNRPLAPVEVPAT